MNMTLALGLFSVSPANMFQPYVVQLLALADVTDVRGNYNYVVQCTYSSLKLGL